MSDFYFTCPICGNNDPSKIGYRNGHPYCRECLSFIGKKAEYKVNKPKRNTPIFLNYELSREQIQISNSLIKNFKNKKNSFVHAVCGSGKTEIVLQVINECINVGYKVGFAVPRRDVAKELKGRFQNIFKENTVTLVCGGFSKYLYGDLIVLTTHQLYRYNNYFDLLILDEIDAFPYNNNRVLHSFFHRSIKGNYILLSATPSVEFLNEFKKNGGEVFELFKRFHGYPLPVPVIKKSFRPFLLLTLFRLVKEIKKEVKPLFIFAPTISICESTYYFLNMYFKGGKYVHSKCPDRAEIIDDFRKQKYWFLVTTAVLERGVTVPNLQVIIFQSDHRIYDSYSLVQIAGRVGRKKEFPEGSVYYVASKVTKEMSKSIEDIKRANSNL